MKNKSLENIKESINQKKDSDKKKLRLLTKLAFSGLLTRILIYALPIEVGGLWIEILWIPLIFLVFALPFYGFEKLLDRIKKE
tara:strand:+ start:143 stop:391 length:249 start_codon:yes stop_codon:yes gene_type:complete